MPFTLDQLRTPQTVADIRTSLLNALAAKGLPVASWAPVASGGLELTRVEMVAQVIADILGEKIKQVTDGRFLQLAEGDWLTYYANRFYGIARDEATRTIQNVRLTAVPDAPPNDFQPGDVVVASEATGNVYRSITGGKLAPGKTLDLQCEAENPGSSYADQLGTVDTMVTAPAGVSCINDRPSDFLDAKLTGTSPGTVRGRFTVQGAPPTYGFVRVRITTFGQIGEAKWEYFREGDSAWTSVGVVSPSHELPGGATIEFANAGNGVSPSFIQRDVFTLIVGDAILQRGADAETDESLRERCRARWASLSDVPTGPLVTLWAQLASPEVDRVLVDADPNTPGGILVTVASASGPASPAAVNAVQDAIGARLAGFRGVPVPPSQVGGSPEETVLVQSARPVPIIVSGIVDVPRTKVEEVRSAAETAWLAHLRSVPIGGIIVLEELVEAVMAAGAIDITGFQLNGAAANVKLAANEVAVPPQGTGGLTGLTFRPV